jgi:uncharacterized protein YjbI with pentapeptide repeats
MSNKKRELREANDNPWYCLATLYGEQPARGGNTDLAARNRAAWNRWFAEVLSDKQRANLVKKDFPETELAPLSAEEKNAFCTALASRTGRGEELPPDPTQSVNFARAHFERAVIFSGFLFVGKVDFSSATFAGYADFGSATFFEEADLSSAKFLSLANFKSAVFSDYVNFNSAEFTKLALFDSTRFPRVADFDRSTFTGGAYFGSATFAGDAWFNQAKFLDSVDFSSVSFLGHVSFGSAEFSKDADFINAEFTTVTYFADVKFRTFTPDFRGAKMHEGTEWRDVSWPPVSRHKYTMQRQVYAYERLKQEMERLKKHEEEQSFFRKELRARRELMPRWSGAWLLNYAYEISSGYGQSILRAMLWLLALFVVGWATFSGFPLADGTQMTIPFAAALSFANIFSFLPIKREIMTPNMIANLSSPAQVVGVVQSLLGIVLLFLLGLALRSRFRMR